MSKRLESISQTDDVATVKFTDNTAFDGEVWKPDADVPTALANVCSAIEDLLG